MGVCRECSAAYDRLANAGSGVLADPYAAAWRDRVAACGCSARVGVPFRPSLPGCDSCYRQGRVLFPVAVVPRLSGPGRVCAACHAVIVAGR